MLKRKIVDFLIDWKNSHKNECLLVKGARQIGKTFIIDYFGKNFYENYISINFLAEPAFKKVFDGALEAEEIYKQMSAYIKGLKLVTGKTLIFLDEIQECPNARTALKFLAIDGRYDVIASGSLLGISYKEVPSIPVGYEKQVEMFSLDFEEFLWAIGIGDDAIAYAKSFFDKKEKVPAGVNEQMLSYLREYIVVGGMPAVVNKYLETKNFSDVQGVQDKIIDSYLEDISKYATLTEKPKVKNCYLSLPKQLAKENKKFQFSVVEKSGTSRKYGNSLEWLRDANLTRFCYNVSLPAFPLLAYEKNDYYKVYVNDIGLLVAMYGFEIKKEILANTLTGQAKGGIYENLIADMLVKNGHKLRYYKPDANDREVEFLLERDGKVIPIEVKSGNNTAVSLGLFMTEFNPPYGYKLINGNVGTTDKKYTLPLYMAMFV